MVDIKKILFFGLGSIGTKHIKLLKKNYNYKIYAYRSKNKNSKVNIIKIYDLKDAFKIKPDIAFITNPTHLHIETAISCLKAGIKYLFIEKPLSNTLNNVEIFLREVEKSKAIVYIGYVMRFNPVLKKLKKLVDERKDQIFYANTVCRSYLPKWRPGIDYKEMYSSKREQGGGVILDLSHEFDYNEWLFGKIKSISGKYGKISELEIDSEDICNVSLKFENTMNASIYLDYFSLDNQRTINIFTPKEEIVADLINNEIKIISEKKIKKETIQFEKEYMYQQQLKYFLEGVENKSKKISNLLNAKELLEKLLKFKKNNEMIN